MAEPKPSKPTNGAMRVDTDLVRELAELLSANALTEIEVEDGDRKIKVRREAAPVIAAAAYAPTAAAAPAPSRAGGICGRRSPRRRGQVADGRDLLPVAPTGLTAVHCGW